MRKSEFVVVADLLDFLDFEIHQQCYRYVAQEGSCGSVGFYWNIEYASIYPTRQDAMNVIHMYSANVDLMESWKITGFRVIEEQYLLI